MRRFAVSLFAIVYLISLHSDAGEIYKWVDKNGKVHYSDKKPDHLKTEVQNVEVNTGINALPAVDIKIPIQYKGTGTLSPIDLIPMKVEFPGAQYNDYKMGKILKGKDCHLRVTDIYWVEGNAYIKDVLIEQTFIERFMSSGYMIYGPKMQSKLGQRNRYQLSAKLVDLNLLSCINARTPEISKNNVYLKVDWEMSDRLLNKVIYSSTTEGIYRGHKKPFRMNGEEQSIVRALKVAIDNLLADQSFINLLTTPNNDRSIIKSFSPINIEFHQKNNGSFRESLPALRDATVTIRTQSGHGSGVILSNQGYIITNAHVVEGASNLLIVYRGKQYNATLERIEPMRDVALLKVNIKVDPIISLAQNEPQVGDDLYVIGTPLSEQLSHTVTRGILSAVREKDGLLFYQTDASINPGNSGGPIFDTQGNLVALSVAGLFSSTGAGLGVNYLIPINDAFKALSIKVSDNHSQSSTDKTRRNVSSRSNQSEITTSNNSNLVALDSNIDKMFELYSNAVAYREQSQYVKARQSLRLALELASEQVSTSDIQVIKDELNFELPLSMANSKLMSGEVHAAQEIIHQLKSYIREHPKRFELSKRIAELSNAVSYLQQAKKANAITQLLNIKPLMSEYYSLQGSFPKSKEKLTEYLIKYYDASVLIQYHIVRYSVNGSSYRIEFRNKQTLADHVIEGTY